MTTFVKRHELWRIEYRRRRYLENLSDADLKNRFEILSDNYFRISIKNGIPKISIHPMEQSPNWIVRITHVFEELAIRKSPYLGPLANPSHRGFLDKVDLKNPPSIFSEPEIEKGTFKYGQREHLHDILNEGIIRICPATHYGKSNYGYSIDDNEMEKYIILNQGNSIIEDLIDGFNISDLLKYNLKIKIIADTDYYIFSMSNSFQYRHVYDYGYDSMLIIKNRSEFIRRFRNGLVERLGKSFNIIQSDVRYVDPFNPESKTPFCATTMKDIKFAYQSEFRVIAVPRNKTSDLGDPIFIKIGPLSDIAELKSFN